MASGQLSKGLRRFYEPQGGHIIQFRRKKYKNRLATVSKESVFVQSISGASICSKSSKSFRWSHLKMTFILFVLTFLSSSIKIQSSNNFGRNKEFTRYVECIKNSQPKSYSFNYHGCDLALTANRVLPLFDQFNIFCKLSPRGKWILTTFIPN